MEGVSKCYPPMREYLIFLEREQIKHQERNIQDVLHTQNNTLLTIKWQVHLS